MDHNPLRPIINWTLGITFVLALAVGGWYAYLVGTNPSGQLSSPIAYNLFFPKQQGDSIAYYTGNTFARLEPETGKTTALTTHQMIPNVTQVYWVQNGVVFNTSSAPLGSDLGKLQQSIAAKNSNELIDYGSNYYWYLSFENDTFYPIQPGSQSPLIFGVANDTGGFVFQSDAVTYSLLKKDGSIVEKYAMLDPDSRIVSANDSALTYIRKVDDGLHLYEFDLKTKKSEKLISNIDTGDGASIYLPFAKMENQKYLFVKSSKDKNALTGELTELNTAEKSAKKLFSGFAGNLYQQGSSPTGLQIGRDKMVLHSLGALDRHSLTVDLPNSSPSTLLPWKDGFLYVEIGGRARIIGTDEATINAYKKAYNGPLEKSIAGSSTYALTRTIESLSDNTYVITYINNDYQSVLRSTFSEIESKGLDPLRFSFSMNPGPGARY